jgi:acetyl-CoA carboxylase biotin carboxyl carrier protein
MGVPEDVNLERVKELVELVEKHHLAELTVEEDGVTITVKGAEAEAHPHAHPPSHASAHQEAVHAARSAAELPPEEPAGDIARIEAPMIGVFYRAASPDSPPLVEVGDTIEVGQTIGLIEAMKVFSEIPSEVAGVVVQIPAENGKLVQQGETLVAVRVAPDGADQENK